MHIPKDIDRRLIPVLKTLTALGFSTSLDLKSYTSDSIGFSSYYGLWKTITFVHGIPTVIKNKYMPLEVSVFSSLYYTKLIHLELYGDNWSQWRVVWMRKKPWINYVEDYT